MIKSKKLNIHKNSDVTYFTFPSFDQYAFIKHGFSTRLGGVSEGIYASMNLSFTVGDKKENVLENYRRFCNALGIDYKNLVLSSQTHGNAVRVVTKEDMGKGITKVRDYDHIDGLITNEPNLALVTHYADCVPLFFLDPEKKVVGVAHAGWKGTVGKIGEKMIDRFKDHYGSNPEDILVGIGPSIGVCCYEVSGDVIEQFKKLGPEDKKWWIDKRNDKYQIDLWGLNRTILERRGVKTNNITVTDICTRCNKEYLFSHRGHLGKRGGLAAVIQLNEILT
ncbi:peptidoglycan editing factor PgeF [Serpentinicella sp. ANB-PHB4]|uniref:peptidoglycan editing factor PgeF n=1 Tax=Serpentinicella sp. ANB-PHB4 TaxID=3074076 RepID=UPI002861B807|nr:peptidoglycan editing factor PgeF [Serpentinicella sp. ANB-PHB4]MDR5659357.1 peptidoglycan editing factor PgeF [Serpentinicella sp. ANB-PHB4]